MDLEAGGWKFWCPACGTPYNANVYKTGLIPANHLWHLEATGEVMLAVRPGTLEENAINEAAVLLAEHAANVRFTDLTQDELQLKMGEVVASHGMKAEFTTMQLSPAVIKCVEDLSARRPGKPAYSYKHVEQGFSGGCFKYRPGETPVMNADGVNGDLALIYCLMQEKGLIKGGARVPDTCRTRKPPIQRQLGGGGR